jgi:hypothetical protein
MLNLNLCLMARGEKSRTLKTLRIESSESREIARGHKCFLNSCSQKFSFAENHSPMATIFFSYSHKDESLRDELETHLAMLKNEGLIESWHDRRIPAGDEFEQAIDAGLERADLILLLVSPDFLASRYCYGLEVARAMELHEERRARVIPVILRPCEGWTRAPFDQVAGSG